jgi:hypothetical protein
MGALRLEMRAAKVVMDVSRFPEYGRKFALQLEKTTAN